MPRKPKYRKPYPPEFRREAVALYCRTDRTLGELAHDLGVSRESLRLWVQQAQIERGEREGLTGDGDLPRAGSPTWFIDGERVFFARGRYDESDDFAVGEILVVDVDGAGESALAEGPRGGWITGFALSPDSERLLFERRTTGGYELWSVRADGSERTRLDTTTASGFGYEWSPDRSEILVRRTGLTAHELWVVRGTTRRHIASSGSRVYGAWSPEGKEVLLYRTAARPNDPVTQEEIRIASAERENQSTLYVSLPASDGRSVVQIRAAVTGKVIRRSALIGGVSSVAASRKLGAALTRGLFGSRIELYDPRSGASRGGVEVPLATDPVLSASDRHVVFRTGRTIRLLDLRSRMTSVLAIAAADPIGLSIEGRRVAWAENAGARGRVRAVVLPK